MKTWKCARRLVFLALIAIAIATTAPGSDASAASLARGVSIQEIPNSPSASAIEIQCPSGTIFCDDFNLAGPRRPDSVKWNFGRGVIQNGGVLWLGGGADIQSKTQFLYRVLVVKVFSLDWQPADSQADDSSIGWEIWTGPNGNCHYGIVLKPNGNLGLLRSNPDPATGDCANQSPNGDPFWQEYRQVPNWDNVRKSGTVILQLAWWRDHVTMSVSDLKGNNKGEVSYSGIALPTLPLLVRLNAAPGTLYNFDYVRVNPLTKTIVVPASGYPFTSTEIQLQSGDQLSFTVTGSWNCGQGFYGPNGNTKTKEPNSPVPTAGLCALVGMIGDTNIPVAGSGFFIGSSKQLTATTNGTLYLGSNDNLGGCKGGPPGNCYPDNLGKVTVKIKVIEY